MSSAVNRSLENYINNGYDTPFQKYLAYFLPAVPYYINAAKYFSLIQNQIRPSVRIKETHSIKIPLYEGSNPAALKVKDYFATHFKEEIAGVIIHGSIATGEEIAYSDFDGLIVLNMAEMNSVSKFRKTALKIRKSLSILKKYDPLQHHGWFVITQDQFSNYPEDYLPMAVLKRSKSLFREINFDIQIADSKINYKKMLVRLCQSLEYKLIDGSYRKDIYHLKLFYSEFMLLPAFYFQAVYGKGIFKKESFVEVKESLRPHGQVLDFISQTRQNWNQHIPVVILFFLTSRHPLLNLMGRKLLTLLNKNKLALPGDRIKHEMIALIDSIKKQFRNNHEQKNTIY